MSTTAPAATTPPAQGNTQPPLSGPIASLFVADNSPATKTDNGFGSLPADLDSIEGFFKGTSPITVSTAAVETPNLAPAPAVSPETPAPAATPAATPPATPATETPAVTPPAEPVVTPPAEVPKPADTAPAPSATQGLPGEVQRAIDLQRSLNGDRKPTDPGYVSLTDAIGKIAEADKPAPVEPPVDHVAVSAAELSRVEGELAELRQQRADLAKDATFYGEAHQELDDKITDKLRELSKAENAHERTKERVEAAQQAAEARALNAEKSARAASIDKAGKAFPAATDKASPLGKRVTSLIAQMQQPDHPEHSVLYSPNAAEIVTERAAIQEATAIADASGGKISFAQAFDGLRAKAAAPAVPAVVQSGEESEPRRVSPVPGATGTPPPAPPTTEADMLRMSLENPDSIDAMLYGGRSATHFIK